MSTTDTTRPAETAGAGAGSSSGGTAGDTRGRALHAAPIPRRPAGVGIVGIILALAMVALGALAVYEAVVLLGWAAGEPPLTTFLSDQVVIDRDTLVAAHAPHAGLLGLLLLWTALKPGRRRGVRLDAATGVWLTWADVERLARTTAVRHDGVLSARARASRRRVNISAETTSREVAPAVEAALAERLAPLSPAPRVTMRARPTGGGDG
jgi:hypothetical protein